MKILMLTAMFMPEVYGGAEKQCLRQSKELVKQGHSVTILSARIKRITSASEVIDGVAIRRQWTVAQPDILGRWIPFTFIWIFQTILFAYQNKGQGFDVVHCHQGKFGIFIGSLISRILKIPQFVKIGNSESALDIVALQNKKIFGPFFLNAALRNKPIFIAISGVIAQNLRDFGVPKEQIVKITNGVLPTKISFKESKTKDQKIKLFWHGRFEPIKNLTLMLEGFALAHKNNKNIDIYLVGNGTEKVKLKQLSEKLGVLNNVHFISPPRDILGTIEKYDIFINTSETEGMSNAMLEAMSLGKAIISTPVSGTAEIIDEGINGFIVKDYKAHSVATAINKVCALYKQQQSNIFDYNIEKTNKYFAIEYIVGKYVVLYQQILQQQDI